MLPVNRDVEKALLGCCILGDFTDVVAAGVSADWFNEIEHKAAFHLMERVSEKEPVTETAVLNAARLDESYKENNGSLSDLIEMTNAAPVAGNWQYWMPELQSKLRRRSYIAFALDLQKMAKDCESIDELADEAESRLMQMRTCRKLKVEADRKQSFGRIIEMLEQAHTGNGLIGLSTGFNDFDKLLSGMRGGQLITLAARPGQGKSALAGNLAINLALGQGEPVGFFSLEMSEDELNARMLSTISEVNLQAFVGKE